ncbi:hypothetical protein B0T22DRAFT_491886 [Podospora appendiculata]|uniref:Protein kinase domain-containing protein n=1 Tax=Podospora appendiculata TaxID=314037 RepID=A0AAE0X480_9PEZI|nr:hypothetical protein B0T22DRAFT_491886 [Podospora appendiculata]
MLSSTMAIITLALGFIGNIRHLLVIEFLPMTGTLKFTFSGIAVQDGTRPIVAKGIKRRNDLRDLCRCIDFRPIRFPKKPNGDSVYKVLLQGDETPTTVGIVQLIAAIVSQNPYQTTQPGKEYDPVVLRGILLEYHPNCTLESAFKSPTPGARERWREWAFLIASALAEIHHRGLAHMDLKPSNVVPSSEFEAVLIDISGIEGVTRKWLCPEMLERKKDPLSWNIAAQQHNDIWTLGHIMLAMADACYADDQKQLLKSVALAYEYQQRLGNQGN